MENITVTGLQQRVDDLEKEASEVRRMAQRADELADEAATEMGEAIIRSEADNLWWVVGEIHDRIERIRRQMARLSARQATSYWDANHDEKGNWTGPVQNENGWTP